MVQLNITLIVHDDWAFIKTSYRILSVRMHIKMK